MRSKIMSKLFWIFIWRLYEKSCSMHVTKYHHYFAICIENSYSNPYALFWGKGSSGVIIYFVNYLIVMEFFLCNNLYKEHFPVINRLKLIIFPYCFNTLSKCTWQMSLEFLFVALNNRKTHTSQCPAYNNL